MQIMVGKLSGFCNGVKYTIEKANEVIKKYHNVYCLGEIVHNESVIKDLESKGMITINQIDKCPQNSKVIIRAHGEIKETYDKAKEKNIDLIDLTCGKIKVIKSKIIQKNKDHFIIIIGKKNHPEALGLKSFAGNYSYIVEDEDDIKQLKNIIKESKLKKLFIISQTTFNSIKFEYLVNKISDEYNLFIEVDKTICNATSSRQKETEDLSKKVDYMIIIGGKKSSNTKELETISKENCKNTYLIQDYKELKDIEIKSDSKVGIMAGASTPDNLVDEVILYLKRGSHERT